MEKRMDAVMTDEQVVRYTQLTARRMEIVMHSGASWKPEYGQELEEIDKELAALRGQVDTALEAKATLCHAAAEGASMESLPCAGDDLPIENDSRCKDCEYSEILDGDIVCGYDPEHQQLKEEIRQAYLNGGRTGYLHDIDGNEYYTTRDGVRHYTRVEG